MGFTIGAGSSILTGFRVAGRGNLTIGKQSVVNYGCRFDNRNPIRLGNCVSVSYGSVILTKGHDIDAADFRTVGAGVEIADYVWLCALSVLQPGVSVGRGAVVLTGSVVTTDVPEFHVVGGNPAAFVRERSQALEYSPNYHAWVPLFG